MTALTIKPPCLVNFVLILAATASAAELPKDYPIHPAPIAAVKVQDNFWAPRLETNRLVTIPYSIKLLEQAGSIEEFALAAGRKSVKYHGYMWGDSDVYKALEGFIYTLQTHSEPGLRNFVDRLVSDISAAQRADGYLMPHEQLAEPKYAHFSEEWRTCELYCMGHLIESGVADFEATGRRNYLETALKCGDLLARTYGPGRREQPAGHPEIELALLRLYRATGERRYLELAAFFINRAKLVPTPWSEGKPFLGHPDAVGHAVAATYLFSAATDLAALTGNSDLRQLVDHKWESMVGRKMYLTGGIGVSTHGEGYGHDYELPNLTAYNETCAAIANALWNYRLFLSGGDARYLDVLERILYNGFLSGVSLSGNRFFYPNPLACDTKRKFNQGGCERAPWFGCSCCPPNMVRFFPQIPRLAYAVGARAIYINLFMAGAAELTLPGQQVKLTQQTQYPWDGRVRITVAPQKRELFPIFVRVPGWALGRPVPGDLYHYLDPSGPPVMLAVNGRAMKLTLEKGFARVERRWKKGDVIELELPMPVRRVLAHPAVQDDLGRVAIERGPVVFCAEAVDHGGQALNLALPDTATLSAEFRRDLLGGVVAVHARGEAILPSPGAASTSHPVELTLVPYYAWANRGVGEMQVWLLAGTD